MSAMGVDVVCGDLVQQSDVGRHNPDAIAAIAMELGCDGVLMNTAIAGAKDPVLMASAMRKAVEAGRDAFRAGRIPRKRYASASSPIDGTIA